MDGLSGNGRQRGGDNDLQFRTPGGQTSLPQHPSLGFSPSRYKHTHTLLLRANTTSPRKTNPTHRDSHVHICVRVHPDIPIHGCTCTCSHPQASARSSLQWKSTHGGTTVRTHKVLVHQHSDTSVFNYMGVVKSRLRGEPGLKCRTRAQKHWHFPL